MPMSPCSSRPLAAFVQRFRPASGLFALLLTVPLAAFAASPTYTWPGGPPCDTPSPQDCIAGVPDGATVQLATDDPIHSELFVDRNITLTAAAGFLPVLSNIYITGSGGIVHGLVVRGFVAVAPGQGMISAKVVENVVLAADVWEGIVVKDSDTDGQPPLQLSIENNAVHGAGLCVSLRGLASLDAPSQAIVSGNRLDCGNGGVTARNGRAHQDLVVGYNQIEAPYGISFGDPNPELVSKPKKIRAQVIGNRVTASYGAAFMVLKDPAAGTVDLAVHENVFTSGLWGIYLQDVLSTILSGEISHNVVAFNSLAGLQVNGAANVQITDNVEFENGP